MCCVGGLHEVDLEGICQLISIRTKGTRGDTKTPSPIHVNVWLLFPIRWASESWIQSIHVGIRVLNLSSGQMNDSEPQVNILGSWTLMHSDAQMYLLNYGLWYTDESTGFWTLMHRGIYWVLDSCTDISTEFWTYTDESTGFWTLMHRYIYWILDSEPQMNLLDSGLWHTLTDDSTGFWILMHRWIDAQMNLLDSQMNTGFWTLMHRWINWTLFSTWCSIVRKHCSFLYFPWSCVISEGKLVNSELSHESLPLELCTILLGQWDPK
jgi:hypothetical protein